MHAWVRIEDPFCFHGIRLRADNNFCAFFSTVNKIESTFFVYFEYFLLFLI